MTIEADGHANATTPTPKQKPPTQVAGVVGIADIPIVVGSGDTGKQTINWNRLLGLPPFQMYACEKVPALVEAFAQDILHPRIEEWLHQHAPEELYASYCKWHADKGCWPNETPMGEVIWQ